MKKKTIKINEIWIILLLNSNKFMKILKIFGLNQEITNDLKKFDLSNENKSFFGTLSKQF